MQVSYWGELALQPCDRHVRRWGMGEGKNEIFFAPPPHLFFLLPIIHPLGKTLFLSPVFHCMKNSRWRHNFLRCERSLKKISPALLACEQAPSDGGKNSAIECVIPWAKRVGVGASPDRSRLVPLTLDYTRQARSKTNREPVLQANI